jgi:hypothetical protein
MTNGQGLDADETAALRAATDGVVEWLLESGLLDRVVRTLDRAHLETLAAVAISGWVKKRSDLAARPRSDGEPPLLPV